MKNLFGFICTLLLIPATALSQERQIRARILDNSKKNPVAFVSVYSSPDRGVISDDEGFFRFFLIEDLPFDSLYFSCIGYQSKAVALTDITPYDLDTIFLSPHLFQFDEIEVKSKDFKKPKSRKIIKQAIEAIPLNYPDYPLKLKGYYREYVKHNKENINLYESIIEIRDSGIHSKDNFAAGLLFKRTSPDFEINPGLMRPYNNVDKFVPYLVAPNTTSNELVILRNHDPVRNFDSQTLYHIDNLESSFIKNHKFHPPQLTYLEDTPYYSIDFRDKKHMKKGTREIICEGTIFISASDYGIKKLNYKAFAQEGYNRTKLFELSLEYRLHEKEYHLNYLSFNNLFMTRNFSISKALLRSEKIELTFNQAFEPEGLSKEDFKVFWKDKELLVRDMELVPDSSKIWLTVDGVEKILLENPVTEMDLTGNKGRDVHDRGEILSKHLAFEITNMKDLNGNPLEKFGFRDYHQYRELFVKDFQTENTEISKNLIEKHRPVFETRIFGEMTGDTSWLNTPLISKNFDSGSINLEIPAHRAGIKNLYNRNDKTITEMIYLHTDREVYAPADTLWFKAYIREKSQLDTSSLSQTLIMKLVNDGGGTIEKASYLIENSDSKGQFILDQKLEEGLYYLTAYSSWMQNYDADQVIVKKILIRKEQRPELQMELVLDRNVYYAGDTVRAAVHCYDELNRDVENIKYSYRVEAGKKNRLASGRSRTSESIQDTLKFVIPAEFEESPYVSILGTHRGQTFDTLYRLPVIGGVHVDFFPEGGKSINGLQSTIAFKAQSTSGEPIFVEGEIVGQDGNLITSVISEHDGMGTFSITPSLDKPLFLKLSHPPGFDTLYALPAALDQGWHLSGTSTGNDIFLDIKRQETASNIALLTVMIRGRLFHYQEIKVRKNETVHIPVKELPAGIAVVTLFDHNMKPRAERLFYINSKGEVGVSVESNHTTYVPRDKVRLDINLSSVLPESFKGSYSLAVVDDQLGFTDFMREPNIRFSFLLSPEIRGQIHNPNYYMDLEKPEVAKNLNLLLMTQGWRSYSYLKEIDWEYQVKEPKNQEMIWGTVLCQPFGREAVTSAGNISVFYGGTSTSIPVNQNGRFAFTPEYDLKYNTGLLISAKTEPPSNYVMLRIDTCDFRWDLTESLHLMADSISKATNIPLLPYTSIGDQFSLGLTYNQWIEEVEIVKKRKTPDDEAFDTVLEDFIVMNKRESGQEDIEGAVDLIGILYNMGIPIEYQQEDDIIMHLGYPRDVVTFVVDGSIYGTQFSFVENFVPSSIEKIFFVKGVETMYFGPNMTQVVVSIKIKRYDPDDQVNDPLVSKYYIPAFEVSKEFYKPLYNTEEKRKSQIPDLRKTIHWDPDLQIGEDGNVKVDFYNGDRYTRVKCVLEGITDEGVPVYREYHYNVSLSRD